jgi:hypothetical protein
MSNGRYSPYNFTTKIMVHIYIKKTTTLSILQMTFLSIIWNAGWNSICTPSRSCCLGHHTLSQPTLPKNVTIYYIIKARVQAAEAPLAPLGAYSAPFCHTSSMINHTVKTYAKHLAFTYCFVTF